jgi:hypothetical protein
MSYLAEKEIPEQILFGPPRPFVDPKEIQPVVSYEGYLALANLALERAAVIETTADLPSAVDEYRTAADNLIWAIGTSPLEKCGEDDLGNIYEPQEVPEVRFLYGKCLKKIVASGIFDRNVIKKERLDDLADTTCERAALATVEVKKQELKESIEGSGSEKKSAEQALAVVAIAAVTTIEDASPGLTEILNDVVNEVIRTLEDTNPEIAKVVDVMAHIKNLDQAYDMSQISSQNMLDLANDTHNSLELVAA